MNAKDYKLKADGMAPICFYSMLYNHEEFMDSELHKSGCGVNFADYAHKSLLGTFKKKVYYRYSKTHSILSGEKLTVSAAKGVGDTKSCLWTKVENCKEMFPKLRF